MIPWDEGVLSVPDVAAPVAPVHNTRKNDEEEEGGERKRGRKREEATRRKPLLSIKLTGCFIELLTKYFQSHL